MPWTWKELAEALVDLLEQTATATPAPDARAQATVEGFCAAEAQQRTTVDQAIRRHTTTRQWPALTDEQWCFVELRINYALAVLSALAQGLTGPNPPPGLSSGAAVQWLLIEGWAKGGVICTHRQLALVARWLPPSALETPASPGEN